MNSPNKILTGTKSKFEKIPGLPPSAQVKAKSREKKREKKQKFEKEKKQKLREKQERLDFEVRLEAEQARNRKNLTAFDVLMQAQQSQNEQVNTRATFLPAFCSPAPLKSQFGISLERRLSFGSSPSLYNRFNKRGSEQLSSPNSPDQLSDTLKKSKEEDSENASPT